MSKVMMKLGSFSFSLDSAAYKELSRTTSHRWSKQDLLDVRPGYQYVGPGEETIKLPGLIYPQFKGGLSQMDTIRKMAEAGDPYLLIDSLGNFYGKFAIQKVDEKTSTYLAGGIPRKIEFTIELVYITGG